MSWKTVKNRILSHNIHSQTWRSEQKSLLFVIEKAKMFGLDPSTAERSTLSNLRTIASRAYHAAYRNNSAEVERLLYMASVYKCVDLRISLGKPRDTILVRQTGEQVVIVVDAYQAGVIASSMRDRFDFQMDPVRIINGGD